MQGDSEGGPIEQKQGSAELIGLHRGAIGPPQGTIGTHVNSSLCLHAFSSHDTLDVDLRMDVDAERPQ